MGGLPLDEELPKFIFKVFALTAGGIPRFQNTGKGIKGQIRHDFGCFFVRCRL